jgi:hypothetical protein
MKVFVGRQLVLESRPGKPAFLATAQNRLQSILVDEVKQATLDASPQMLRELRAKLQIAAVEEANRLFPTIAQIIDQSRLGTDYNLLTGKMLAGGSLGEVPSVLRAGGNVEWRSLTLRYANYKRRKFPHNAHKFFVLRGGLKAYFNRFGVSIVHSRLGGVQVEIADGAISKGQNQRLHLNVGGRSRQLVGLGPGKGAAASVDKFIIGTLRVRMFPKLSPLVAPGLFSGNWANVNQSGRLEEAMFGGLRTAAKLVQRHWHSHGQGRGHGALVSHYRGLVAPAVQFWVLVRLPNVLRRRLTGFVNRSSRGQR